MVYWRVSARWTSSRRLSCPLTDTRLHRALNVGWSSADLMAQCPVCGSRTLHRWYHQEDTVAREFGGVRFKGHGRLWEWCSTCQTFEYLPDGLVPEWWTTPFNVEPRLPKSNPEPFEDVRRAIH